jgi:hypothetical protein
LKSVYDSDYNIQYTTKQTLIAISLIVYSVFGVPLIIVINNIFRVVLQTEILLNQQTLTSIKLFKSLCIKPEWYIDINVKCCVQFLKQHFLLSTLTDALSELPCSHDRAVLIYTEALAGNCILWGVQPEGLSLWIRYDTLIVNGDGRCLVPHTERKGP